MKSKEEVLQMLGALIKKRREQGNTVTIDVNAPLALMQLAVESKIEILKWVLKDEHES